MRRTATPIAAAVLLASPAVLGFFSGGYGEEARLVAGIVAWLLAGVAAFVAPRPLPGSVAGRVALGGLAALALLTLLSVTWAPLKTSAYGDAERVAVYLGVFVAAVALRLPRRAVEPALVGAAALLVAYGLSERVVPGVVELQRSPAAGGRLAQPLGYWNAMGAVAAVGLVLAAGVAGDRGRGRGSQAAALALAPLLGAGVALSFSRGALLAVAIGAGVTVLGRPTWIQARATVLASALAGAAGILAAALPSVADLAGPHREAEGAALGVALVVLAAAGALAARFVGPERGELPQRLRRAVAATGGVALIAGLLLILGGEDGSRTGTPQFGATASRLSSVQSNRYAYWKVAAATWADHPLAGAGASAFAVEWLKRRTVAEGAHDAHSLPIETAAELGLVGLLALAAFGGGVAAAGVAAARRHPGATAALAGGLAAWVVHACLDWAWEIPSDALFGVLLAAALVNAAET